MVAKYERLGNCKAMDDVELIKQKINIVDLISEYLPLKKAGVNFKASCPFHQEKTPSFMVSPERQIFHCFGCGIGGDIFKFLMEKEGIDFKEALEILAKKAGVILKHKPSPKNSLDKLFAANQKAAVFFEYMLIKHTLGKPALEYLEKRGLTTDTIKTFQLGYAPLNWEVLSSFLLKRGFSEQEIIMAGLAVPSGSGCYDRFRGRIMFPLVNVRDQVIGFAGRILGVGEPKYINSPQTPIFDKGKFLYGLNLCRSQIREKKQAIVVEGEMDMIASYQAGVKNVVASKGTALTEHQIENLKKYADTISLCFDSDLAGDSASRRGIEMADKAGLNIKVIQIDSLSMQAKDPADLCLKDALAWHKLTDQAIPIYDYYLNSVQKRFNVKDASGKKAIFAELLPIWRTISDPIVKEHYIQKLSSLLLIKDEIVRKEINNLATPMAAPSINKILQNGKDDKVQPKDRRRLLEEYLISLLLHLPENTIYVPNFPETLFTEESLRQLYVLLVLYLDGVSFKGKSFKINEFVKTTPPELLDKIDRLYLAVIDEKLESSSSFQKELDLCISELKKMLIKASLEKLSLEIKQAQSFDNIDTLEVLNKRFRDLSIKLKNL